MDEDLGNWVGRLVQAGCEQSVAHEVVSEIYDVSLKTRKERAASGDYTQQFEDFWKRYPRTPIMSKKEAWAAWKKLSGPDHAKALSAVPKYIDWLAGQRDCPVVHACRFLSQRRFDGLLEGPRIKPDPRSPDAYTEAALVSGRFYARAGSPQLKAWNAHRMATEGRSFPRDRNGGWMMDSEWPPSREPAQSTGSQNVGAQ